MPIICPTITALNNHEYREQMELVSKFAPRVHIDLMDGKFTSSTSPNLRQTWWPDSVAADIHLMYAYPEQQFEMLLKLKPSLVVWQYEAQADHALLAKKLKDNGIKAGLAILQPTTVSQVKYILPDFDELLVFSGNLGYQGGHADLRLLDKVKELKDLGLDIEIAWDGGINDQNTVQLIEAGISVLNVGGYIHRSDDPAKAYAKLEALAG